MKKEALALTLILALLFSALAGILVVKTAKAPQIGSLWWGLKPSYDNVTVLSPENETIDGENITLKFIVKTNNVLSYLSFCYTLDTSGEKLYGAIWNDLPKVEQKIVSQTVISNDSLSPDKPYDPYTETTFECTATLPPLSYGEHNITIYRGYNYENKHATYRNLQTFYFTVTEPK